MLLGLVLLFGISAIPLMLMYLIDMPIWAGLFGVYLVVLHITLSPNKTKKEIRIRE